MLILDVFLFPQYVRENGKRPNPLKCQPRLRVFGEQLGHGTPESADHNVLVHGNQGACF